jgi:hypothetical protein
MKTLFLFLVLGYLSFPALAQSTPGQISGRVLDVQQNPVEFATVALVAATSDSAFVKATYTDATGAFAFESQAIWGTFWVRKSLLILPILA